MALTDDLISYWKLDEASGNALDATATGNTLTDTGSVGTNASGKINSAREFVAASSQYFVHTSNASLTAGVGVSFTLQAWIYINNFVSFPFVLRKGTATDVEYFLFLDSSLLTFKFGVSDGGGINQAIVDSGTALSGATWYLVHAWHEVGVGLNISINDGNVGTPQFTSYTFGSFSSGADFTLGGSPTATLYWDGRIDEVGFWKRVLTSGERTQLYNGGSGLAYSSFGGGGTLMGQILT